MSSASVLVCLAGRAGVRRVRARLAAASDAAAAARADELVVVVGVAELAAAAPASATVLLDEAAPPTFAGGLRVATDWCAREGHDLLFAGMVGEDSAPAVVDGGAWARLAARRGAPVVIGETAGAAAGLFRLDVMAWPLLPLEGSVEAALRAHAGLVEIVEVGGDGNAAAQPEASPGSDRAAVAALLGREPRGPFRVAVRDRSGAPVVIENAPFLDDGTPMPTTYWLVGRRECEAVGRLEAAGGVRRAEAAVPAAAIAAAHERYAAERDARIAVGRTGPRPSGGVGGTRTGVKCLHAHLAWYLAGGGDPVGRFVAHELAGELEGPVAAIDCGTNSTRLLVVDRTGARLARETRITRLGERVDETGRLAPAALGRTLAVLGEYRELMDRHGVVSARCAATSAARDATNASELFDAASAVLGIEAELLSGEEEGRLAYAGATVDLEPGAGPYVVVDLGGGSTELVTAAPGGTSELVSLAMGCVRLRERFVSSDPPSAAELTAARAYCRPLLVAAVEEHPALVAGAAMVGVAGTVSTLALLAARAPRYVFGAAHHLRLTRAEVGELLGELAARTSAERAAMPAMEAGRADVVVAGALVLDEVMDVLGYDELICSESDILDGLCASLLA